MTDTLVRAAEKTMPVDLPGDEALLDTGEVLRWVSRLLDRVDHQSRRHLEPATRVTLMQRCRTLTRRVEGLEAALLAEVERHQATERSTGTPLTSFLAQEGGQSQGEATATVFTAHDVAGHERVQDATLTGSLSLRQARATAKAVNSFPASLTPAERAEAERLLIKWASRKTTRQIPDLVPAILASVAPASAPTIEDELTRLDAKTQRARNRRSLRFTPDGDGAVTIHGSLPTVQAHGFEKLINALVESDRRAGRDHGRDRLDQNILTRTPDQRRADALCLLVEQVAAGKHAPTVSGDRPRVVVHLHEEDLRSRAETLGVLGSGEEISAGELRRLCCQADLVPMVLGTDSAVLDVGHDHRLVTPEIRRSLSDRDGQCQFPGCGAPDERCEAHHVKPWWDGGPTALNNLVLLCPYHHSLVEPPRFWSGPPPDRWSVRMTAAGRPEFHPPQRLDGSRTPIAGTPRTTTREQKASCPEP